MSTTTVERAIDVFNEAIELEGDEREAFLARACVGAPALLAEVRSLLATEERVPPIGFLEVPNGDEGDGDTDASSLIGQRVGSYTIIDVLGEGGMGVVFRAEQESPHRCVALKLIRPGLMGRRARHRFIHEAEVLGRLKHPGIAQIFEAGTADTPHGTCPFFAMELVEGLPLTEHAERHGLDTRERLLLMARICDAVHHAHQHGVIHRDLKPGNILVDETGLPKILDFGVARAVDSDVAATTMRTHVGELVGTLHYMSPEQCAGDPGGIDTRSDIYTLGVLCWQLLTGALPYDVKGRPFPEVIRVIREDNPGALRSASGIFRGDVETIVAKAIEKDRERRYQSASSLADDLRRYLRHEPIAARPPSAMYQLRRFARRNRALVGGIAAVFLVLIAGITATTWQAVRATRGWVAAEFHQDFKRQGGQVYKAIVTAILRADPVDEDALDRVLAELSVARRDTFGPATHEVIGDVYGRIGRFDLAESHLRRALADHRAMFGDTHAQTLRSINVLGDLLRRAGHLDAASSLVRETLERRGYVTGDVDRHLSDGNRRALALRILSLEHTLAETVRDQGNLGQADTMFGDVLDAVLRVLASLHDTQPELHGYLEITRNQLVLDIREARAELLLARGRFDEAESVFRELQAIDHELDTLDTLGSGTVEVLLGETLLARSSLTAASALLTSAESRLRAELGPESPWALRAAGALGRLRLAEGRVDDAETLLASVVEAAERRYPEHWRTAVLRGELGIVLMRRGRHEESDAALTAALDALEAIFAGDDHRVARVRRAIGDLPR